MRKPRWTSVLSTNIERVIARWFLLILFLLSLFAVGLLYWQLNRSQEKRVERTAVHHADVYSEAITAFRTLYTSEVVSSAQKHGLVVAHDYKTRGNAIPLPATLSMEIGKLLAGDGSGGETRLYSPYPFPWRKEDGGLRDAFERDAWLSLSNDPGQPFSRVETRKGGQVLRYATADIMRPDCIDCHNTHPETPKTGWRVGDVRGILEVTYPLEQASQIAERGTRETMYLIGPIFLVGVLALGLVSLRQRRWTLELETQVKLQTTDLRRAKEYVDRIVESMGDCLIIASPDAIVTRVNVAATSMLLYSEEELIGKPLSLVLETDTIVGECETTCRTREGTQVPVLLSGSHLSGPAGVEAIVCVVRDITRIRQVEVARRQTENEISRASGMAEVATGVLHNVGNVVNSVNISAGMAQASLEKTSLKLLDRVVSLLHDNAQEPTLLHRFLCEDPRGKRIVDSLVSLVTSLQEEHAGIYDELDSLREHIRHIIAIVASQQEFARSLGVLEEVELAPFLDKAIALSGANTTGSDVAVEREYQADLTVHLEPHKLMQIVVNLLSNARDAVAGNESGDRSIKIQTYRSGESIRIAISDNGSGITYADLANVFAHGFTTKADGHGFGLHSSATVAMELGGSLIAESDGQGMGAKFLLQVPWRQSKGG